MVAYILSEMVKCGDSGESALPRSVGVGWGHWLVVPGLIVPKLWMTSCLVKMTCSFTLSLSSRTLLAKGWKSGSTGGFSFSTQYCNPWHKSWLREKATGAHPVRTAHLGETHFG